MPPLSFIELFTNERLRKELNVHYLAFLNYYRITKGMLEAIEKTEAALEAEAELLGISLQELPMES